MRTPVLKSSQRAWNSGICCRVRSATATRRKDKRTANRKFRRRAKQDLHAGLDPVFHPSHLYTELDV